MRKQVKQFFKDILMLSITVVISSSIGAWAYVLTRSEATPSTTLELPEPIAQDPKDVGAPATISSQASILGLTSQRMEDSKPVTTYQAYLGRDVMMYFDEGKTRWETLPEGTIVFVIDDARESPWKAVYYTHGGANLKLFVETDAVVQGEIPEKTNSSQEGCQGEVSHGHVYKNTTGHGTNVIHVNASEENLIIHVRSDQGAENSSYVSKGRSIDVPLPHGTYWVSFVMGKNANTCGEFDEAIESKRDPQPLVLSEHMRVIYNIGYGTHASGKVEGMGENPSNEMGHEQAIEGEDPLSKTFEPAPEHVSEDNNVSILEE